MSKKNWVVVTTVHRGVFFGLHDANFGNLSASEVRLRDAQMCVYWSDSTHGVLGLASTGPNDQCRITNAVDAIILHGVTSVMYASDEAISRWKSTPWSD